MISRIWHGWTNRKQADEYEAALRADILPGIHRVKGYLGAYLLRREAGDEIEFVTITQFTDMASVKAFAGDDYEHPVIHPTGKRLLSHYDDKSVHYETILTPEDVRAHAAVAGGASKPATDLAAIQDELAKLWAGDAWHGASISEILDGIDAQTASARVIPNAHTIWELVLHMTGWTREVARRVGAAEAGSPKEDWPMPNTADGESAWKAAVADFAAAHRELEAAAGKLSSSDLTRWIVDRRDPKKESGQTVGNAIRGIMEHHTYHGGQIALLKKAARSF